ncbi:MAG: hypothetical protein U5Q44_08990 [Dehalococcoidia bacterium]|nr:hypothetical protein [Dehalococcoidia bacterium]
MHTGNSLQNPTGNTPSLAAILDLVSALEREAPEARETTAYDTPTNPTLYNEVLEIARHAHNNDHPSPNGRGTEGEGRTPCNNEYGPGSATPAQAGRHRHPG